MPEEMTGSTSDFFSRYGKWLLIIGGAFILAYMFIGRKNKQATNPTANANNLLGSQGNSANPLIEYVPTTGDSYSNINYTDSTTTNNRNVTTTNSNNSTSTVNSNNPVTTPPPPPFIPPPVLFPPRPPVNNPPPPPPPPTQPTPPPPPPPPPPKPATKTYTVVSGDTLSGIAGRFGTTWPILYNMNKGTIDQTSAQHGNPIPGGSWNNIFPGEVLQVPA